MAATAERTIRASSWDKVAARYNSAGGLVDRFRPWTASAVAAFRRELKLDLPAYERYSSWLWGVLQGDMGRSLANQREISELIGGRLSNTLFLAVVAAIISVPLALTLGVLAALYRNSIYDRVVNAVTLSSISFPEFFVAYILVLFLAKDSDQDGVLDDADFCPDTVIPEGVPTNGLGKNRFALVDGDFVFDTNAPNGEGPGRSYSTTDTAGCSCEQIIDARNLGNGHTKFGCSIDEMDSWVSFVTSD